MTENNHNDSELKIPDRPLECTECKRPIAYHYTEIVGDMMTHTSMCAECPVLNRRLHGTHLEHAVIPSESVTALACGNCGTTLEAIKVGTLLGCEVCYEVFDDILLPEMLAGNKIPSRIATTKKSVPIHIGRAPGEIQEINPSLRLLALNEALNEMLKSEKYEQAAWLRDQIKALTDQREAEMKNENMNQEKPNAGK